MEKVLFVTGIDTNIGKTYATAFLAKKFSKEGQRIITQKLIQTGCVDTSEDIDTHRALLGDEYNEEDKAHLTAPVIFSYPASPHLAAKIDKRTIDFNKIDDATSELIHRGYHRVLLEGAGGIMVPLTEDYLIIDFIRDHHYPVAIVTSGRLGSINHTLLTIEACLRRNIKIERILYNLYPQTDSIIEEDTMEYIREYIRKHLPKTEFDIIPEHH